MQLAIDSVLKAFTEWYNLTQTQFRLSCLSTKEREKIPEGEEERLQQKEREAAQRLDVEVQIYAAKIFRAAQIMQIPSEQGETASPSQNLPMTSVAPLPMCKCGHSREQHLKGRGECGVLECSAKCQEFQKTLKSGNLPAVRS